MNPREDAARIVTELLIDVVPPELGPGPRPGARPQAGLEATLKSALPGLRLAPSTRDLVRALVLLWHDHLDAAHTISQAIENPDGSLVHGVMHRREPDYWNSKYWWRLVGQHPCFPEIARRVAELLESKGERELRTKLVANGKWDPFAFVDACEAAAVLPPPDERVQLLRQIQQIESDASLQYFLAA